MRLLAVVAVACLLAGCGVPAGSMGMRFPSLTAEWSAPGAVHAMAVGEVYGRDMPDGTVVAYLVRGACPDRFDIPTAWIDRGIEELPSHGRFRFEYRLALAGNVSEGEPYAVMVGMRHPDTVPERGWCSEFTAGANNTGRAVYP